MAGAALRSALTYTKHRTNMTLANPLFVLSALTLLSAIAFGTWQYRRVRKAQIRRDD